jgi:hypothetical protein
MHQGNDENKWLAQNGRLVASGEVDEDGNFHAKNIISHEYRSDDETGTVFTFPVGMKVKADLIDPEVYKLQQSNFLLI